MGPPTPRIKKYSNVTLLLFFNFSSFEIHDFSRFLHGTAKPAEKID